jgi:hypothetical protein
MANTISAVPEKGCRYVVVFPLQSNKYCNVLTRTVQYMMNERGRGKAVPCQHWGRGEGGKCTAKPVTLPDSCPNDL